MLGEELLTPPVEIAIAGQDLTHFASPEMLRHMVLDLRQMKTFIDDPLVMARAEGVWYWDVRGRRYLDGISGIFTVNVGHANPRVRAALHRQIGDQCQPLIKR